MSKTAPEVLSEDSLKAFLAILSPRQLRMISELAQLRLQELEKADE